MEAQPLEVVLYVTEDNSCPFERWLESLRDRQARARIRKRLDRIGLGNLGDFKSVGEGIMELRIDYGPGYRIYCAQFGATIILLICGGDKSTQNQDIIKAKQYWIDFQNRQNANL
ncbi:addiction module protein [[Phormidium ambiguum] IAM M-71]|uniref:Addiction module protein n=1 Tax=[Phormidium ambiguum] IAM M-71 TaxID=454136 RepID=A0A1U7I375_9CYAN|nr:type II toxin-antitoxin system RelE/ParE family toxin [Phormidium ambiguum]OKH30612.1 addiction module protein [Phormidium ambiguum IAM M-71]